jgi:hypothetical protein
MKSDHYLVLYDTAANHGLDFCARANTNELSGYTFYAEQISGAFMHLALIIWLMNLEYPQSAAVASFLSTRQEVHKITLSLARIA